MHIEAVAIASAVTAFLLGLDAVSVVILCKIERTNP